MTDLKWWQAEQLCEALLVNDGALHTEMAAPRRKRHVDGDTKEVKDEVANDLFETFDVVALFPDCVRAPQVYSGTGGLSDKLADVKANGPWPKYLHAEVWHWERLECAFEVWRLDGDWDILNQRSVSNPTRVLHRADTSLG